MLPSLLPEIYTPLYSQLPLIQKLKERREEEKEWMIN